MSAADAFASVLDMVAGDHASLEDATADELAAALQRLRSVRDALGLYDDDLADRIATDLGKGVHPSESVGMIEVTRSSPRKAWDHEGLWKIVTARGRDERRIDHETGEALESEADAVVRTLKLALQPSYWRVTYVRDELGIQLDEYVETTPGRPRVKVP